MEGMQGWPSWKQVPSDANPIPSPAESHVAAKDGSLPLGIGVVLLLIGGFAVLLAVRSPDLDAARMTRAPISPEGTATVTVDEPGFYVAYLESDCTQPDMQFSQAGQPVAQWSPPSAGRFPNYSYLDRCAASSGLYSFSAPGTWTATNLGGKAGYVAVYRDGDRPTEVEAGTLWVAGAFLVAGAALTAIGLAQRRGWRRVNESPQPLP